MKLSQRLRCSLNRLPVSVLREDWRPIILILGVVLLLVCTGDVVSAQGVDSAEVMSQDDRIAKSIDEIIGYLAGSFGALIMVAAGLSMILLASFGPVIVAIYGINKYGIRWWWSPLVFFIPFASLVFIVAHWNIQLVRRLAYAILGCFAVAIGSFVIRSLLASFV